MAEIKNTTAYPTVTPNASDLLIATDVSDNNKTVTFLVSDLLAAGTVLQDLQSVLNTGNTAIQNINLTGTINLSGVLNFSATQGITIANATGTAGQVLAKNATNTGMVWTNQVGSTLTWQEVLDNGNSATSNPSLIGVLTIDDGGVIGQGGLALTGTTTLVVDGTTTFRNHVTYDDGRDVNFSATSQINVNSTFGTAGQFLAVNAGATGMEWTSAPTQTTPNLSAVLSAGNSTGGVTMSFVDSDLSMDSDSTITSAALASFTNHASFSGTGLSNTTSGINLAGSVTAGVSGIGLNGQVLTCIIDPVSGAQTVGWASAGGSQTLQSVLDNGNQASALVGQANIAITGNATNVASASNGIVAINDGMLYLLGNTEIYLGTDVGTAGQALVSGGPNALPQWATVGGGGSGTVTSVSGTTLPIPNISNYISIGTNQTTPAPVISSNLVTDGSVSGLNTDFYNASGAFSVPEGADWDFTVTKASTVVTVELGDNSSTPRTTSFSLTEGTGIGLTQAGNDVTIAYTGSAGITSLGLASSTLDLTQTVPNTNPATTNGNIDINLSSTAVTPGTYTLASVTVDAYGRITGASSGSDNNTTYDLGSAQATNDVNINLTGSDGSTDTVKLVAGTNITLTDNSSGEVTIDAASAAGLTSFGIATDPGSTAGTVDVTNNTLTFKEQVNDIDGVNYNYIAQDISATNILTTGLSADTSGLTATTKLTHYLRADNTWAAPAGSGTVTSIGLALGTAGTDISVSNSPVTASGNITLDIPTASSANRGALSSADWSTFNSKEPALTKGNLTENNSAILTITNGSNAVIGSGTSIEVAQASNSTSGYLSSTDWQTFNGKTSNTGTVTSVGLSYTTNGGSAADGNPAFIVSASPVTTSGTIDIDAQGTAAQYITGQGKLATLPSAGTGTVTSVSAGTLDGVSLTITNPSTTPSLSITNSDKGSDQNIFKTVAVSGQNNIVADTNADTLTFAAGTGITLTTDSTTDTLTINATNNGTVTSVTGTTPISSSGGSTPDISIATADATTTGALSSTDWNTFNNKTSNLGTVTSVDVSYNTTGGSAVAGAAAFTVTGGAITSSGTIALTSDGTSAQYIDGTGKLVDFPTLTSGTVTSVGINADSGAGTGITTSGAFTFSGGTLISTSVTGNTVTFNHSTVTRTNGTSSSTISVGGNFDVIDSITSNATGHITAVNTKTVTLPEEYQGATGASNGVAGFVPQPLTATDDQSKYLKGDGTWSVSGLVTSIVAGTGISVSGATGNVTITASNNGSVTSVNLTGNSGTGTAITGSGTFDIDGITTASSGSTTNHFNGISTTANNFDLDISGFAIPDENEYWFYRANSGTGTSAMGLQKSIVYGYDDAYKSLAVANGEVGKEGYTLVLGASASSRAYIFNAGNTTYRWSNVDAAGTTDSSTNSIFIGANAGAAAATNADNIGIGSNALLASTNGASNIALGTDSGKALLAGARNILIGKSAGQSLVASDDNIAIGDLSLSTANSADADQNIAVGKNTLSTLTTGARNIAIGHQTLADGVLVQTDNIFLGYQAGMEAFGGADIGIGYQALLYGSNSTPNVNTNEETGRVAIGYKALAGGSGTAVQGIGNVALGGHAGEFNATSVVGGAVYVGHYAGNNTNGLTTTGFGQVAIGKNAMKFTVTSQSIAIGYLAMEDAASPTIGGNSHVAIGKGAMRTATVTGNNNIAIGTDANSSTANVVSAVVALGYQSKAKGTCTIAIGCQASAGDDASSTDSIAIGNDSNTAGTKSISIGRNASTTGTHSIAIGDNAQVIDNYSVAIGAGASTNAANQLAFGTAAQNLGSVVTQTITPNKTWEVRINGVNYLIPIVAAP
mgnify:CR=1 FL=1